MTADEARQILSLRRGPADDADPQIAAALEFARHDPELQAWLQRQEAFHQAARTAFRQIEVPSQLASRLHQAMAQATANPPAEPRPHLVPTETFPWWQRFPAWAAATAAAAVVILALVLFRQSDGPRDDDSFATYRSRMVRSVLRQYQMDMATNSLPAIRQFLADRQAPADFPLRESLQRLPALGAGLLRWQGSPVAMVCLDSGGRGTAILFVVDASNVQSPPPAAPQAPELSQVSRRLTASWTDRGKAYLLLLDHDSIDPATLREYL